MIAEERKASPELIRLVWTAVKSSKTTTSSAAAKVVKYITANSSLSEVESEELLRDAVCDGLLEVSYGIGPQSRTTKKSGVTRTYRIPLENEQSIKDSETDLFCFECHSPKNLLKCSTCPRVFHESCTSADRAQTACPERPSTNEPAAYFPPAEPEIDDSHPLGSNNEEEKPSWSDSSMKTEIPTLTDETTATETKDVICIGEVRPPSRRRKHLLSSYKDDTVGLTLEAGESNNDKSLCKPCKLLQTAELRNPPNMSAVEMNYLLRFIYERIRSWISLDTFSPLQFSESIPMPSKQEFDFFAKKCFKFFKTFDFIEHKLTANAYNSLTEFQCDVMDIGHCMGILYGVQSGEYEAFKYLISDCNFELSEIQKCPDCYRHSNEKSNKSWFCKPCVPRHELVFAKQIGYAYWPAKVIKFQNNLYDVRFFGSQHTRAVIPATNVKPIDSDLKQLKIKRTITFNKAMDEFHMHQELLQWPPGRFSYDAERTNPVELPNTSIALSPTNKTGKGKKFVNNPPVLEENEATNPNPTLNLLNELVSSQDLTSPAGKRKNLTSSEYDSEDNMLSSFVAKKKAKTIVTTPQSVKAKAKGKLKSKTNLNSSGKNLPKRKPRENEMNGQTIADESDLSPAQNVSTQSSITKTSTPARIKSKVDKAKKNIVETLRNGLTTLNCPSAATKLATETLQVEIERWQLKLSVRVKQMTEDHRKAISETKRRQWCYNCEKEAIYHCCWNTAYCSTECQQSHWQTEHKKACRRKR